MVTVKPRRHTNERKLFKGVQLAKQTGNDYVLVIKYLEPLALSEDFEVAFTGDEQLSGLTTPNKVVRRYADGREGPFEGLKFVGVDRRVLKDIVLAGPQQDYVGLMDDADGSYFAKSPTGGRPVSLVRAFDTDCRDGTQWSRWRR